MKPNWIDSPCCQLMIDTLEVVEFYFLERDYMQISGNVFEFKSLNVNQGLAQPYISSYVDDSKVNYIMRVYKNEQAVGTKLRVITGELTIDKTNKTSSLVLEGDVSEDYINYLSNHITTAPSILCITVSNLEVGLMEEMDSGRTVTLPIEMSAIGFSKRYIVR